MTQTTVILEIKVNNQDMIDWLDYSKNLINFKENDKDVVRAIKKLIDENYLTNSPCPVPT